MRLKDKQKIISIIENAIDDFSTKWSSHTEKDNGVEKYAEDILEMREIYAKECSQASLEKASESLELVPLQGIGFIDFSKQMVSKESITNPENIVLL